MYETPPPQVVATAAENLGGELSDWQRRWCTEEARW